MCLLRHLRQLRLPADKTGEARFWSRKQSETETAAAK